MRAIDRSSAVAKRPALLRLGGRGGDHADRPEGYDRQTACVSEG